jgi:hypothetical protein
MTICHLHFIANLAIHTSLVKEQKTVSENTCAKLAAAEQVNCSPTFVAYLFICTELSLPFFQSHFHDHHHFLVLRADSRTKQNRITGCTPATDSLGATAS